MHMKMQRQKNSLVAYELYVDGNAFKTEVVAFKSIKNNG